MESLIRCDFHKELFEIFSIDIQAMRNFDFYKKLL